MFESSLQVNSWGVKTPPRILVLNDTPERNQTTRAHLCTGNSITTTCLLLILMYIISFAVHEIVSYSSLREESAIRDEASSFQGYSSLIINYQVRGITYTPTSSKYLCPWKKAANWKPKSICKSQSSLKAERSASWNIFKRVSGHHSNWYNCTHSLSVNRKNRSWASLFRQSHYVSSSLSVYDIHFPLIYQLNV